MNKINEEIKINDKLGFEAEAFFIDLDGTTLDKGFKKNISQKNLEALREKNKITPVIISTGRSFSNKVKKIMEQIGCKYAICQNGAVIVDNEGTILKEIGLNDKQINKILSICKKYQLIFTINGKFEIFTNKKRHALLRFFFKRKFKKTNLFYYHSSNVNKFVLVGKTKKKINAIYEEIKNSIPNTSIKTSGHDYIIEITHEDATKGYGALFVSNLLNVNPKKTVHIGDSQNDTTTLDVVGALIAMKNSSERLLNVATHIGPSYKRGGVSKVINGQFERVNK